LSNSISTKEYPNIGARFQDLYDEGIALIQRYSGGIWTDYNHHDPGVTILEYAVYALMDLSYRTNLPVEDLFFLGVDDFDSERKNLLAPPEEVFHIDPYTTSDYRRMIIDRVRMVKNVWVNPVKDDASGYKGLYEVLIQSREDLGPEDREKLYNEVSSIFCEHRNLGCDLGRLVLLEAVPLTISGTIHIDVDAIGEYVLSKVYAELDSYINPEVAFHDPYDLIRDGHPTDEVFSGPRHVHGLILKHQLRPKSDSVFVSRMRDIVSRVPGVKGVDDFRVMRRGLPVQEDQITFTSETYPIIEYEGLRTAPGEGMRLLKNNIELEVDPVTARQLLDFDLASRRSSYLGRIHHRKKLPNGRFTPAQVGRHYSMHNEFPAVYGLGEVSQVPQSEPDARRAQAKQLRAYLAFFEQIVANHLAQLTHVRNLLSVEQDPKTTYYTQYPEDIPYMEELLFVERESHRELIDRIANEGGSHFGRMNRVLDHLMSRFSEHIDTEALRKHEQQEGSGDGDAAEERIIEAKVRFLKQVVDMSSRRNTAFNYRVPGPWDTQNVSVLETKLALLLNIRAVGRRSLIAPLLSWLGMKKEAASDIDEWYDESLVAEGGAAVEVTRLAASAYSEGELRFPKQGVSFISHLFSNGTNPRFLRVVPVTGSSGEGFAVLLKVPGRTRDVMVFESADASVCEALVDRFKSAVASVNRESEGFHMIEHILLRPLEPVLFIFNILDQRGEMFISGYFPGSIESQTLVAEELPLLGMRIENFSLVSDDGDKTFRVVLYDSASSPAARLSKTYNSRTEAEQAMQQASEYLIRIHNREVRLGQVLEITAAENRRVEIPDDFDFSNTLSFVLPAWPARFQNADFIHLFKRLVKEHMPAHFDADIYLLDPGRLSEFEDVYGKWLAMKSAEKQDLKELDMLSLQLIQTISRLKSRHGAA
jgi:hypothetical protein